MRQFVNCIMIVVVATLPARSFAQPSVDRWSWTHKDIPSGPFASWSDEDRHKVPNRVALACTMHAGMQFSDYRGPKDAMMPGAQYLAAACLWHAMPDDYPGRSQISEAALQQYAIAKKLDPSLPDPEVSQ